MARSGSALFDLWGDAILGALGLLPRLRTFGTGGRLGMAGPAVEHTGSALAGRMRIRGGGGGRRVRGGGSSRRLAIQRGVDTRLRLLPILFHRLLGRPHGLLGLAAEGLYVFSQIRQLRLAHGFIELRAKLCRLALDDANVLADRAQQRRQVLWTDDEQRHDAKDQEFAGGDVEHRLNLIGWERPANSRRPAPVPHRAADGTAPVSADLVRLHAGGFGRLGSCAVDRLGLDILPGRLVFLRLVVFGHALFEAFDALGNIAHDRGYFTAAPEHQQGHRQKQQPMPNTQATHSLAPLAARAAYAWGLMALSQKGFIGARLPHRLYLRLCH